MSPISDFFSANKRSAQQYERLIIALRAAADELRYTSAGFEDLLCRLLPHLIKALEAEAGFIYCRTIYLPAPNSFTLLRSTVDGAVDAVDSTALPTLFENGSTQIIGEPVLAGMPPLAPSLELTSALVATLQTSEQEYLLLICNKDEMAGYPFVAADRTVLNFLLTVIAAEIRAEERLQREHDAVQAISELVANNRTDALWQVIVQSAARLANTKYAHIFAYEEDRHRLVSKCNWNVEAREEIEKEYELDLDSESLNTYVADHRTSVYVSDLREETFFPFQSNKWEDDVQSAYCIPLISQNELVGTLYVAANRADGIALEDRQAIDRLAPHAAVALNTAKLIEQTKQTLELDEEIIMLQQEITDVLREEGQIEQIEKVLDPHFTAEFNPFLALWNTAKQEVELHFVHEAGEKQAVTDHELYRVRKIGKRRGLMDYMYAHNLSILDIPNFSEWENYSEIEVGFQTGLQCCLIFALHHRKQLVGWLGFRGYNSPYMFDNRQRELLRRIAPHIATVLYNSHEYEQKIKERNVISEFQTQISELTETEAAEIRQVSRAVREALGKLEIAAKDMYIALYDQETHIIHVPLVYVEDHELSIAEKAADPLYQTRHRETRYGLTEHILTTNEPILIRNRSDLVVWEAKGIEPLRSHFMSWVGVPMRALGKTIGVMALRSTQTANLFNENHVELLQVIANEAAITLENARQYEAAQTMLRYNKALYETGRTISRAGFRDDEILQTIVKQAKEVTGSLFGVLYHYTNEQLRLECVEPPEFPFEFPPAMELHEKTVINRALRQNKAQLIPDVNRDFDYKAVPSVKTGSQISVVIRDGADKAGKPLGIINIEHPKISGLTERERTFVIGLADLAAIAMQNAERARALQRNTTVAVMGAWGAEVIHDLNQHLNDIHRNVYLLRNQRDLSEEERERLAAIKNAANHMTLPQFPSPQRVNPLLHPQNYSSSLDGVLQSEINRFRGRVGKSVPDVQIQFQDGCPNLNVNIHERWLRFLLRHYLTNAARHLLPSSFRPIVVRTLQENGNAAIYVENYGAGVSSAVRPLLFEVPIEPTEQTSGCGLLMVRMICEQHGGKVWLASSEQESITRFAFLLPIVSSSSN